MIPEILEPISKYIVNRWTKDAALLLLIHCVFSINTLQKEWKRKRKH